MVFFRNLSVYRLPPGWSVSVAQLQEMLARAAFAPTTDLQAESTGWAPVHDELGLVHAMQDHLLLRMRTETRVMPAKAIDLQVDEAAAKVEEAQGHKPGKRQRREIREQVIDQMLPAAFRQQDDVLIWIDTTPAAWSSTARPAVPVMPPSACCANPSIISRSKPWP